MAAADHLDKARVSFVVLETQRHMGGLSHAFMLGHESVGQYVLEQGSNWVCGCGTKKKDKDSPTVRTNRMLHLAAQEGLQTANIFGACDGNMSNYFMIFVENGKDGDPTGKVRQAGNDALDCVNRSASVAYFCNGRANSVKDASITPRLTWSGPWTGPWWPTHLASPPRTPH